VLALLSPPALQAPCPRLLAGPSGAGPSPRPPAPGFSRLYPASFCASAGPRQGRFSQASNKTCCPHASSWLPMFPLTSPSPRPPGWEGVYFKVAGSYLGSFVAVSLLPLLIPPPPPPCSPTDRTQTLVAGLCCQGKRLLLYLRFRASPYNRGRSPLTISAGNCLQEYKHLFHHLEGRTEFLIGFFVCDRVARLF